jgi:hypothetical protein
MRISNYYCTIPVLLICIKEVIKVMPSKAIYIKYLFVRFEVFTPVTMKNAIFWDVAPCRSCMNRRFGGTYRLHLQGRKIRE